MRFLKLSNMKILLYFPPCLFLFIFSYPIFAFGVLMTTPEERIQLNIHRNTSSQLPVQPVKYLEKSGESVLRLDGLVKRHNGPNSVWINGSFKQKESVPGVFIDANKLAGSAVFFDFIPGSSPVLIKPGQRFNIDKGDVSENYMEKVQSAIKTIDNNVDSAADSHPPDHMTEVD